MNTSSKIKAVIYLTAIFVIGLAAGGTAGYTFGKQSMSAPPRPKKMAQTTLDKLKSELSLTPEQVSQIKPIVSEAANEIQSVHASICERIWTIIDLSNERMEQYLTPEQAAKLRSNEKLRREQFKKSKWDQKKKEQALNEALRLCQRCGEEAREGVNCSNEKPALPAILPQ